MYDNGFVRGILVLLNLASSEGSDEPVHMRSLARAFSSCIHKEQNKRKVKVKV